MDTTNIQLNDPDFDQKPAAAAGSTSSSPFAQLSPKILFLGGIAMGIMTLCTLGFFILLSLFLKGG